MINSELYQKDLLCSFQHIVGVDLLKGKRILVTGGTGLIGEPVVDMLIRAKAIVYVAVRSFGKSFSQFGNKVIEVIYDANRDISFDINFDYVIHAASNAHPEAMRNQPVETLLANVIGINNLLHYAKTHKVKRVLFVSSSEVYGKKESSDPFDEDAYGYVDILNPRSCYPMGKRAAETLCASYTAEYEVDTVITRLGHIYGPTASRNDSRVSSLFAYQAAEGKPLTMKSAGSQLRSYMYCIDCASALISVLLNGKGGEAYNIANENYVATIRQMAENYAKNASVPLNMESADEVTKQYFNPMYNSSLNSQKLKALGWHGCFDSEIGFAHTIEILKEKLSLDK